MQEVEVYLLEKTIADVTFAHGSMDRSSKTTGEGATTNETYAPSDGEYFTKQFALAGAVRRC